MSGWYASYSNAFLSLNLFIRCKRLCNLRCFVFSGMMQFCNVASPLHLPNRRNFLMFSVNVLQFDCYFLSDS